TVFIADGHHRYETALAYRELMKSEKKDVKGDEPFNYVMMYLCSMEDEGLVILPTHRVVNVPLALSWSETKKRLGELFQGTGEFPGQSRGNLARSRALFRAAVVLVLTQSTLVAVISITALQIFGDRLQFPREMLSALAFVLCALPGIALYRVCTSTSRGMKVMKHDIYSRGMTEPVITTLALLIALGFGFTRFAPEVAAVSGTAASGIVALIFASRLFTGVTAR